MASRLGRIQITSQLDDITISREKSCQSIFPFHSLLFTWIYLTHSMRIIDFQRYDHVITVTQIEDIRVKRESQVKAEKSIIEQFVLYPYRISRCIS